MCKLDNSIYFLLCGNGVKDNLEEIVSAAKLEKRIILQNNRDDIPKVLNSLDCFYFPSITEGQPNSLIEAMVKSLPFVASNINAIVETVPLGFHGQLIEPLDVISAKEKIIEIKNNFHKNNFKKLGKTVVNLYDAEYHFNQFYKEI